MPSSPLSSARSAALLVSLLPLALVAACGGGTYLDDGPTDAAPAPVADAGRDARADAGPDPRADGGPDAAADAGPTYTVRGTIAGLVNEGLSLQLDGANALAPVGLATSFDFEAALQSGASYAVTVAAQPTAQTCTVQNATGQINGADATDVAVTCSLNAYPIGGAVVGLAGSGLVLQNVLADDESVTAASPVADVPFTFDTEITSGNPFDVTVLIQPTTPSQTCVVTGGTGTVVAGAVTTVVVNCTTDRFTVGGTVAGLVDAGVKLKDQAGTEIVVNANGTFAFEPLASGTAYSVEVSGNPQTPTQICTVSNGTGTLGGANVTNVAVTCETQKFPVGGAITGLVGDGLQLKDQTGELVSRDHDDALDIEFATAVDSGQPWSVLVQTQPTGPAQTCVVTPPSGTIGSSKATVAVVCTTNEYTLGGTVSGLPAGKSITVRTAGKDLAVNANGDFQLPGTLPSGTAYAVTVDPVAGVACSVSQGTGTLTNANVADVAIVCRDPNVFRQGGVDFYLNRGTCGQACNDVCAAYGKVPADDATVFAAQNEAAECTALSQAFGMNGQIDLSSFTYACLETGNSNAAGDLVGPLLCSNFAQCPSFHRTSMDGRGQACAEGGRYSICGCN